MLETNYNVQQKSVGSSGVPGGCSRRFIVSHLISVACVRQTEWPAFRHKSLLKSNLRRTTQHQPPGTPEEPSAFSPPRSGFVQVEPIVPPSAAPSRPVNFGLGDLVLIATCLYSAVW